MSDLSVLNHEKIYELLNREDIHQLRIDYSNFLDSNNIDLLDQVFSKDAIVQVTVGTMKGIENIKKGLHNAFKLFDEQNKQKYPFLHVITNHQIQFIDHDHATGSCYLLDFETSKDDHEKPLFLLGLYRDTYQRIHGEWRITQTQLEEIWNK